MTQASTVREAGRWIQRLQSLADVVGEVGMVVSAGAVALMTILVTVEVLLREFFNVSTNVATELGGYLLVVNVFLGLAWTFRSGAFIRADLFYGKLPVRARRVVDVGIVAVSCIVLLVFTLYLWSFVLGNFKAGDTSISTLRTPLWIPQIFMPIGATMLVLAFLAELVRSIAALTGPAVPDPGAAQVSDPTAVGSGNWL